MSKAFVKDDDTWDDPEIELDPQADIPDGSRNYMTPQGASKLRDELDDLVHHRRPRQLATLNRLNREGLGSTDATYREARKSLQRLERRIAFVTGRLAITEVIDPLNQDSEHIRFGATVTVQPAEGPQNVYRIVGIDEAHIVRGRISWTSPLARSLLDGKAGDIIKVNTPAGEHELEIIKVRYCEISQ
jgi:transcription elongation factor GreB